jgi:pyruvate kinase
MSFAHRHTKIIATLGPATESLEMLKKLITQGADVMRLNMAHGSHDWVRTVVKNIREASKQVGHEVAILMDVKGPEIRTGVLEKPFDLKTGDTVDFLMDPKETSGVVAAGHYRVLINYPSFSKDVKAGQIVLVDSGLIRMEVISVDAQVVRCKVLVGANMGSRRHINLPGADVALPAVTQKDRDDVKVAVECGLDWIAQSFVRKAEDVRELRDYIKSIGGDIPIMAKFEDQSAIRNLDSIVKESNAVMVARGDLGVEIPIEDLPIAQQNIVESCLRYGTPVVVATHMLESMITAPFPTRAEITDIAHAVWQKADCVMLSGETSLGKFPLECVETLEKIAVRVEGTQDINYNGLFAPTNDRDKMILSAIVLAQDLECSGIVLFSHEGESARAIAALRPMGCPIYVFTDNLNVYRQINLNWGIEPFFADFKQEPESIVEGAINAIKAKGYAKHADKLVVLTNVIAGKRIVNSIQLRKVE